MEKTMAKIEITIDDEQMEAISEGRGLAALLKPVLDEILEAEMTEQFGGASPAGSGSKRPAPGSTECGSCWRTPKS
jgi:transposase-like protein